DCARSPSTGAGAATARSSTWREPSPAWTSGACFDSTMIGPPWHGSSSAATSRLTGQNHRLPTSWPEWTGSDPVRIELVPAVLGCCSQSRLLLESTHAPRGGAENHTGIEGDT